MAETAPAAPAEAAAPVQTDNAAAPETTEGQPEGKQQRLSRQFAALSRKERQFEAQRKQFEADRSSWEAERSKGQQELQRLANARARAKEDKLAWLEAGGFSYDDLVRDLTGGQQQVDDPRNRQIEQRMAEWEKRLADRENQLKNVQEQAVKQHFLDRINSAVQASPDDFELLKHFDAAADVYEYMDLYAQQHNEVIDVREACLAIEAQIEIEQEEHVKKALAAKKLAKRIGWDPGGNADTQPGDEAEAETPPQPPPRQQRSTRPARGQPKITNALPSSAGRASAKSADPDDLWESIKERSRKRR